MQGTLGYSRIHLKLPACAASVFWYFLILFFASTYTFSYSSIHDCMQFEYVTTNRFQFWKLTDCLKIFIYATKNITFTTFINEGVLMAIFLNEASPRSESSARPRRRLEFQGRVHPQYQKPFLGHLTICKGVFTDLILTKIQDKKFSS